MSDPDTRMFFMLQQALSRFTMINERESLSDADKLMLKKSYLENFVEPEARELLKEKLAQRHAQAERDEARRRNWRPTPPVGKKL